MKLVIEVKKEDYKRYKEDKVCLYASAVLDAVPLDDVLDEIRAEIQNLRNCSCSCSDGIIDDVEDIIDKYREGNK